MVVSQRRTLMTADELFDLPDDDCKYELVRGELIRMSPTGAEHGALTARVGRILDEYAEAQRSGVCCGAETGFILQRDPDVVRAPDAAFVYRSPHDVQALGEHDQLSGADVLPGFRCGVGRLFS